MVGSYAFPNLCATSNESALSTRLSLVSTHQVHKDSDEGHRHFKLGWKDGQDASAEHPHAAQEMLQPPVPVRWGRTRPAVHHRPPPGGEQRQDGGAGQAPP